MKKKIIWLILSGLMVAALLLASCAPAVTEEEEVAPAPEEEAVVTEEEVAPSPEGPQYGGVLNLVLDTGSYGLDNCFTMAFTPVQIVYEDLFMGDWTKGPAGTGEVTWRMDPFMLPYEAPCLCESWEMPDEETIVFHIRKGVHFHDKPPVNGRELTAEDVAFSIDRYHFSGLTTAWGTRAPPRLNISSVEATDKYTVVVKCNPLYTPARVTTVGETTKILPPEAGGEYPGDFRDVEDCIGTGPFVLVDEVPSSALTYVRNPNYWRNDPLRPENSIPYLDGVRMLVIVDSSTRLAALRTGKIDTLSASWEDRDSLVKTNPELQWTEGLGAADVIGMRVDKPELPFHDIRVRRALAMGLDRQAIAESFYGGNAEVFAFPVPRFKEFKDMFRPLDEFSESIQELYEYNPDKARQLLAEAGYPDGFQTEIVCTQKHADLLAIIKANWADIGVDLKIDVREMPVYRGMAFSHTHKQMYISGGMQTGCFKLTLFDVTHFNTSMVDDEYLQDMAEFKLQSLFLDWGELSQVMKEECVPYALEHCWYIDPPTPMAYTFWQPWLKGYHGETSPGAFYSNYWATYVWLDQELKKEMTGR